MRKIYEKFVVQKFISKHISTFINFKLQYILSNNVHLLVKLKVFYALREYLSVYKRFALLENAIRLINFDVIVMTLKYFLDMDFKDI